MERAQNLLIGTAALIVLIAVVVGLLNVYVFSGSEAPDPSLQRESEQALTYLLSSPGTPADWDAATVERAGLLGSDEQRLDLGKLARFGTIPYPSTVQLLGKRHDYAIVIKDEHGLVVTLPGTGLEYLGYPLISTIGNGGRDFGDLLSSLESAASTIQLSEQLMVTTEGKNVRIILYTWDVASGQAATTACSDDSDNDRDGRIDYPADPGCSSNTDDDESDGAPTACSDGADNDGDSKPDWPFDPGCTDAADDDESDGAPTACSDGSDNDGDGLTDFPLDPGCLDSFDGDETDTGFASCSDGLDNDKDGRIDFPFDPGCASMADTSEANPEQLPACADRVDNDGDGRIDFLFDLGCLSAGDDSEIDPTPSPVCRDGSDNDGDGLTDYPWDPGCTSPFDPDEANPATLPACSDGADNDADTLFDFFEDPGCQTASDNDETNAIDDEYCGDYILQDPPEECEQDYHCYENGIGNRCWDCWCWWEGMSSGGSFGGPGGGSPPGIPNGDPGSDPPENPPPPPHDPRVAGGPTTPGDGVACADVTPGQFTPDAPPSWSLFTCCGSAADCDPPYNACSLGSAVCDGGGKDCGVCVVLTGYPAPTTVYDAGTIKVTSPPRANAFVTINLFGPTGVPYIGSREGTLDASGEGEFGPALPVGEYEYQLIVGDSGEEIFEGPLEVS